MDLVPGPTACILTAYGVNIQTWNETRAETCGLDIDDSYWLVPFQNHPPPRDGSTNCITGLTEDISLLYWAPCIDGSPMLRSELSFPKHMGSNYSCLWNPQCLDRTFKSEIICYVPSNSSDVEVLKSAKGEAASQHRFIPPVFFIIFWCLFKDEYFWEEPGIQVWCSAWFITRWNASQKRKCVFVIDHAKCRSWGETK